MVAMKQQQVTATPVNSAASVAREQQNQVTTNDAAVYNQIRNGNGVNHSVGNENSSTSGGGSSLNVSGGSPSDSDALSGSAVAAAANVEDDRSNDSEIEEKLLFSGTDPDTIELAKSFWKSVTLQPPLESSLISTHIQQRLPKAPKLNPASNKPNLAHKAAKKDAALDKFFMRANQKMLVDRAEHIKRLAYHRMQMLQLLEKRKKERIKKELVSEDFKPVKASEIEELASMTLNGSEDDDAPLYTEEELEQELAMLKTFETTILREIQTPSTPPTSAPEQDTK
ncbi:cilia- and flagella-associated protein HOATZ-like isoform X2 [Convolutriloba macropyga]|uniref:cilia- and flagella-associated protein HOATZ-like isoform X2 n=1 Tax=Convolutriloba macropyga TaxID=536237 RepID=UPI003F51F4A6